MRAYGADPELVAQMGTAAIRGYQETGLLACAKHFPGHGDTSVDSHLALPVIPGDRRRLESVELIPFRAAISAGVGAIMTTHILFPALDAERPATLSSGILTGLLREQLGYDGLVITDCLEMKAIVDTVGTAWGAVEALKAGADMVLIGHTLDVQRAAVQAIRKAIDSGELPEARLNEAVSRVFTTKQRFLAALPPAEGEPWRDPAHDALEQEIARASITVFRSAPNEGYRLRKGEMTAVISAHHILPRLAEEIRRYQPDALVAQLEPSLPEEQVQEALQRLASVKQCLFATAPCIV